MPHGRLMFSREHYEAISRLLPFLCHGNRHTHDPPAHERTVAVLFRDEVGLQRQAIYEVHAKDGAPPAGLTAATTGPNLCPCMH